MAKREWIICGNCIYFDKCPSGKAKLINVDKNSAVYNEIGCYDYEQVSPKQMKLL